MPTRNVSSAGDAFIMSIKNIISLFLLLYGFIELRAQVDAQFSQYWALPNYYNAGAVGQGDKLNIRAGSRQQWVGMPGAPKTFFVSAEMPFRFFKLKSWSRAGNDQRNTWSVLEYDYCFAIRLIKYDYGKDN